MATKEEWLTEFQVLNGRQPSDEEWQQAQANQFQMQAPSKKAFDSWLILKIAFLLLMAAFGYVIGFLFA